MRSITKYLFVFAFMVVMGWTAVNAQEFAGGKRPKSLEGIEAKIHKEIVMLPQYGLFDYITYRVNGDTVILDGSTNSLGTKSSAEKVVKHIAGVTNVVNNIRELPPSASDERIRLQLTQQLGSAGVLAKYLFWNNPPVRLIVDRGHVTLEGYVDSSGDANTMYVLANGVPGVFSVTNHLQVISERVS